MLTEQDWEKLKKEFERGHEIVLKNQGKPYTEIEQILKKEKVGNEKIRFDSLSIFCDFLGTSSSKYDGNIGELAKEAEKFVHKRGLRTGKEETQQLYGRSIYSGNEKIAFAGTHMFVGKTFDIFKYLAIEVYGY